jgi:hypothetical protein
MHVTLNPRIARAVRVSGSVLLAVCGVIQPALSQTQYPIAVDADLSPHSAGVALLTLQRGVAEFEDRILVPRPFHETGVRRRALGFGYRFGKLLLLDSPQDELLGLVNHEVFGHGFRFRELGLKGISYDIKLPPPYGPGTGAASYESSDRPLEPAELMAIDVAGIEANNVAAQALALRAVGRSAIHYREANAYLLSILDGVSYVMRASDATEVSGDDVADFLVDLNAANRGVAAPLRARSLKRGAAVAFANPMIAYAGYAVFVSYLGQGRPFSRIPSIRLGSVRYLPWFRFQMTPYGTEWISDHTFARATSVLSVSVRSGNARTMRTVGAEVQMVNVVVTDRITVNAAGELWRQPALQEIRPDSRPRPRMGGLATGTVMMSAFGSARSAASVLLQAGFKSAGFTAGERLPRGAIVRVGLAVRGR